MSELSRLVAWLMAGFFAVVPNYAFAILAIGITFMLLIIPFTLKSTRSMLAMQKLQPRMKQLQQQHKDDKLALQQAMSQLYKDEGVSPLGGCVPAILPLPLLYVLYHVIQGLSHVEKVKGGYERDPLYINNKTHMYRDLLGSAQPPTSTHPTIFQTSVEAAAHIHALGLNLAASAYSAISQHLGFGEILGSLFLVLLNVSANFYQQVQLTNLNPMMKKNQQSNPQMRFMRYIPIFLGVIWIRLGSGLVMYYAVSAMFRVGQQWMMYQYDPRVKELVAKDDHDIEMLDAKLNELEQKQSKPGSGNGSAATPSRKLTPPRAFVEPVTAKATPAKATPTKGTGTKATASKATAAKAGGAKAGATKPVATNGKPASKASPTKASAAKASAAQVATTNGEAGANGTAASPAAGNNGTTNAGSSSRNRKRKEQ